MSPFGIGFVKLDRICGSSSVPVWSVISASVMMVKYIWHALSCSSCCLLKSCWTKSSIKNWSWFHRGFMVQALYRIWMWYSFMAAWTFVNQLSGIQEYFLVLVRTDCGIPAHSWYVQMSISNVFLRELLVHMCCKKMIICWTHCSWWRWQRLTLPIVHGAKTIALGKNDGIPFCSRGWMLRVSEFVQRMTAGAMLLEGDKLVQGWNMSDREHWFSSQHVCSLEHFHVQKCFFPQVTFCGFGWAIHCNIHA